MNVEGAITWWAWVQQNILAGEYTELILIMEWGTCNITCNSLFIQQICIEHLLNTGHWKYRVLFFFLIQTCSAKEDPHAVDICYFCFSVLDSIFQWITHSWRSHEVLLHLLLPHTHTHTHTHTGHMTVAWPVRAPSLLASVIVLEIDCVVLCSVAQSYMTLCNPMDCNPQAHQASLSVEFSKQEYWSGFPFHI